jgi:SpoVK/Ycf46/Vps4 family AAA+-type ATPase
MDGIEPLVNVTIVAATNRPDIIDSALLRPGRIDSILYVSPPNFETRESIFRIQFKKIPAGEDVEIGKLASLTEGFSGAETVAVCQEAAMMAMDENLNTPYVYMRHFVKATLSITPRITAEMLAFYDDFRNRSGLRAV